MVEWTLKFCILSAVVANIVRCFTHALFKKAFIMNGIYQ